MDVSSSSGSANSGDKGRVCICFWYDGVFKFYILDFDEDDNSSGAIEKSPAFRIHYESRRRVVVCLSDPYLYVIGAVGDVQLTSKLGEVWMSRYDLRRRFPSETATVDIGPSELEEGRVTAISYPKFRPGITASPDGSRVVVYSRYIKYSRSRWAHFENDDDDFEVFDTKTQNWSQLPPLMLCTDGDGPFNSFYIKSSNSEDWTTQGLGGHLFSRSIWKLLMPNSLMETPCLSPLILD